eukprot:jgi/Psemu1/327919/estExt_fgenesh1_pg.C_8940001
MAGSATISVGRSRSRNNGQNSGSRQRAVFGSASASVSALLWSAWLVSACLCFRPGAKTTTTTTTTTIRTSNMIQRRMQMQRQRQIPPPLKYLNDQAESPEPLSSSSPSSSLSIVSTNDNTASSSSSSSSSSSLLTSWFPNDRQVLEFREPTTNVTVLLIGSMHYNPASIRLVERTIRKLGDEKKLGSDFLGNEMRAAWEVATSYERPTVLGDQRINVTIDALKASLGETASDLLWGGPDGWKRSRDEIAANWDKTIPIGGFRRNSKKDTDNDAVAVTVTDSDTDSDTVDAAANTDQPAYLNAVAFFDPRLLLSLPVSLVKYPLSFLVKDPVPVGTFFALIAALNVYQYQQYQYGSGAEYYTFDLTNPDALLSTFAFAFATHPQTDYPWTDYVLSLGVAFVETVVFARLLLKPLLADRNEILARSVLDQCRVIKAEAEAEAEAEGNRIVGASSSSLSSSASSRSWFKRWFAFAFAPPPPSSSSSAIESKSKSEPGTKLEAKTESEPEPEPGIVYVPGCEPETLRANRNDKDKNDDSGEKVVVAVLGMAHCNGVMKLLRERRV